MFYRKIKVKISQEITYFVCEQEDIDISAWVLRFLFVQFLKSKFQWGFLQMERKFSVFSKFRESEKSLKHELRTI